MSVPRRSAPLIVACLATPAGALTVRIDSVVRVDLLAHGVPGVPVVVTRGDETLVERAWGLADLSGGREAEPSTIHEARPITRDSLVARAARDTLAARPGTTYVYPNGEGAGRVAHVGNGAGRTLRRVG